MKKKPKPLPAAFLHYTKHCSICGLPKRYGGSGLKLVENIVLQSEKFTGSFEELTSNHAKQSNQFYEWVSGATESQLVHVFAFVRNKEQI